MVGDLTITGGPYCPKVGENTTSLEEKFSLIIWAYATDIEKLRSEKNALQLKIKEQEKGIKWVSKLEKSLATS